MFYLYRFYCQKAPPEIKPPGKVKKAAVKGFVGFLGRLENKFEKKYPRVFKIYILFKNGKSI